MWEEVKRRRSGEEEVVEVYGSADAMRVRLRLRLGLAWLGLAYQVYSAYSLSSEINLPDLGTTYLAIRS